MLTGTAVVHCPWANLKLGSGTADVPELIRNGITVMLGSDGAPCNNRLDLSGDRRLAVSLASVKASPETLNSSKWNDISGQDAADFYGFSGFGDDYAELELTETEQQELELAEDTEGYVSGIPRAGRVKKVVCAGRVIYDNGEFPTLPPLPMSVAEARKTVWNRALKLGMKP
jgi:5-methylthioadenosine/S-adenosylhomocysteine deaminase